jgi:hypothetical protein
MKEETMRICLLWLAAHVALRARASGQPTQAGGSQRLLGTRVRATPRPTNTLATGSD